MHGFLRCRVPDIDGKLSFCAGRCRTQSRPDGIRPVYSHIWYGDVDYGGPSKLLLSSMLSIRNTDPGHSITIKAVRYYGTDGKLLREENAALHDLGPLASTDVFVEYKDTSGGTGANFIVVWEADAPVNPPIIETVHTYFRGTQLTTFNSRGTPIRAGEGQSK
jgi:hypothetical protein